MFLGGKKFGLGAPHKIKLQHALQNYWYIITCAAWIASCSPIYISFEKHFKSLTENRYMKAQLHRNIMLLFMSI